VRRDWTDRDTGVEYAVGALFRVTQEGAKLSGWTPRQGYHQGWGQDLHVGDVIECTGFGPGWGSDPGYGVEWTSPEAKAVHASAVMFRPYVGGAWAYRPAPGYLVPHLRS